MSPTPLEDVFPLSEIFCLPLYVDFLIHATVIAVSVIINQILFFHIYSEKWKILRHYNNLNGLPNQIKISIMQHHHRENLKIIDVLSLFITNHDIVNLIYSYLESSSQIDIFSITSSPKSSIECIPSSPKSNNKGGIKGWPKFQRPNHRKLPSMSSIDLEIKTYGERTNNMNEMETLKEKMEEIVNKTKNDDMPIWRDKEYLNRYLSSYANNIVFYSCMYSICVLLVEFLTFILIIYEFSKWKKVSNFPNAWNYYNGWCIVTSLIQPFLRYYKFLFFYTMDFGSYHPHYLEWENIMKISNIDKKYGKYINMKQLIKRVNIFQIILSLLLGFMWIPLLPGAILLMLAIFCFITALGVPFYILYAVFQYFRECYFDKIKICHCFIKGLQQFTLHLMILIILTSIHFCLYSSILSTSVSLYNGTDVVGCLNYEWDWKIHKWHWKNIFVVLSWIFL